jgi:hypothetical protein
MGNTKDVFHRVSIVEKCVANLLTQLKASELLGISLRQMQRLVKDYKAKGKLSLLRHGLANKPSNHSLRREQKEKILEIIKQDKYRDFGPTLLGEYLEKYETIRINVETLRLWLKENKLQTFRRKRKSYRTKRERKEHFGQMLQIDGSFHRWFISKDITNKEEGKACLLNLIDDTTNTIELLFDKQETTKCASLLLWQWIKKYGIPLSIYCDKRNMYLSDKDKEKTELNNPKGYFRTMCTNLNIEIIQANSPQAKGRVERGNKTHQDRLTKALKYNHIVDIENANRYLREEYVETHNKKFTIALEENRILNVHRQLNEFNFEGKIGVDITLNDICYIEEIRKLRNDWTVSYKGKWYQLKKQSQYYPPTKATVYVRKDTGNNISIFHRNMAIEYTVLK